MYVLTSKRDGTIIGMGAELDYMSNGYPRLIDINLAFPSDATNVYEVDEIPDDVRTGSHCYTSEGGFYKSPSWVEPYNAEEHVAELEQQLTDLQMALCDVYEMNEAKEA